MQAATSRLAQAAAGAPRTSFDDALAASAPAVGLPPGAAFAIRTPATFGHGPLESKQTSTDRRFEAMVLQNFVENILPKDSDLFGDKASADMCRSLLAEQVSNQLARSGRVGIAKSIERFQDAHRATDPAMAPPPILPGAPRV